MVRMRCYAVAIALAAVAALGARGPFCSAGTSPAPVTGIVGAMPSEVDSIEGQMSQKRAQLIRGVRFVTGLIGGRRAVIARSGIGKVNAAMVTALLISHFGPSEVIFTGVAGGLNPELAPGDIVIGSKVAYHDYGFMGPDGFRREATANPITGDDNPRFFAAEQRLVDAANRAASVVQLSEVTTSQGTRRPNIIVGVIATGDMFVSSPSKAREIRESLGADAVEMEGAAVAQVCSELGVPFLVIRSISDRAGASARAEMARFLQTSAENSAKLTSAIVRMLAGSRPKQSK